MDKATLIGIVGALGFVVGSNVMEGGSPAALFKIPAMLLVIGGTFGAAMACGKMGEFKGAMAGGTMAAFKGPMAGAKRAFTWKAQRAGELVPVVVELAGKARREGLLT